MNKNVFEKIDLIEVIEVLSPKLIFNYRCAFKKMKMCWSRICTF